MTASFTRQLAQLSLWVGAWCVSPAMCGQAAAEPPLVSAAAPAVSVAEAGELTEPMQTAEVPQAAEVAQATGVTQAAGAMQASEVLPARAAPERPLDPLALKERRLDEPTPRSEHFATRWILPAPPAERDLVRRMRELASLRFDDPAATEAVAESERWTRSFGDLVRAFAETRGDDRATRARLAELERDHPLVWADVGDVLPALVRSAHVYTDKWEPGDARDDDGFFQVEAWSLKGQAAEPWRSLEGSRTVQQLATLAHVDPATLKTVESDYTRYMDRVASTYLSIGVEPGSVVRGRDERGEWATMRVHSHSDLPWPFSSYRTAVDVLCEGGEDGTLVTHVVSESPDFYWLAGRDAWIPVRDADDELVATLVVRELGFDLDGVPDGDSERRAAIRSALGNLKREAEQLALDPAGAAPGVPKFSVRSDA